MMAAGPAAPDLYAFPSEPVSLAQLPRKIPSLGRRLLFGVLILVPLLLVFVALPATVFATLSNYGFKGGVPESQIFLEGSVLALLGAARYVLKPTQLYGPISMGASITALLYLYTFVPHATFHASFANGISITVGYAEMMILLMIVPAIEFLAGAMTTIEDFAYPGERLPFDYPVT